MAKQFQIGIEVEHAIINNSKAIPASGLYGYDKEKPLVTDFGTIHEDGAMFEIAINPTYTAKKQYEYYEELVSLSQPLLKPKDNLGLCSSLLYSGGLLERSPGANSIGCSPSKSAYHPKIDSNPSSYENNYRFAGLHVNVDFEGTDEEKYDFVKKLDYHLGLYSVAHWEEKDSENNALRRKFYGQAGNCRLTPFGVEYRTLPAMAWSKENCEKIYSLVDTALSSRTLKTSKLFEDIINNSDSERAKEVLYGWG